MTLHIVCVKAVITDGYKVDNVKEGVMQNLIHYPNDNITTTTAPVNTTSADEVEAKIGAHMPGSFFLLSYFTVQFLNRLNSGHSFMFIIKNFLHIFYIV
jgi:hypothetical protein